MILRKMETLVRGRWWRTLKRICMFPVILTNYSCFPRNNFNRFLFLIDTVRTLRDRLCGLVLRVSGYRYRGLGFDSRRYQIF